jgi:hypothetical protein
MKTFILREIDDKLHKRFKRICVKNGKSMKETIIEAMENYTIDNISSFIEGRGKTNFSHTDSENTIAEKLHNMILNGQKRDALALAKKYAVDSEEADDNFMFEFTDTSAIKIIFG